MNTIGLIGYGAMATYVAAQVRDSDWSVTHCIIRDGRQDAAQAAIGKTALLVSDAAEINAMPDLVVDCAGHQGLLAHGAEFLRRGVPVVSASLGALADEKTYRQLEDAACAGETRLQLASGAIGGLDALAAARIGGLNTVRYTGTKPPESWRGTPAEAATDLDTLDRPFSHFEGTARDAALHYPRNANVAAAVALAGLGFDRTEVILIADPAAEGNIHAISAAGKFGNFHFRITGNSLPDTPRTSALAAMSVVERIFRQRALIVI